MASSDAKVRSLEELYALMELDRNAAASAAADLFQKDVEAAINAITNINAVASARVQADTQAASARIMNDAEGAAAGLAAVAQMAIAEYTRHVQAQSKDVAPEVVKGMVSEIGTVHSSEISKSAAQSIEDINRNAEATIAKLKGLAVAAISDISDLAKGISVKVQVNAALAVEKLKTFRQRPHTLEEVAAEADKAAKMIADAAEIAADFLRQAVAGSIRNINLTTDDACENIGIASKVATERIVAAMNKAQHLIHEMVLLHLQS